MTRAEADVLRLLQSLYGAGLGEQSWAEALQSISTFFGAAGAVAFDLDRRAGAIPFMQAFGVEQAPQGDYADRMNAINPRMKRALTQPGCHTSFDYEGLPEEAIRHHEFYDWLIRECGVKYFIGSRMIDAAEVSSFISVEFTPRQGHANRDKIEIFRALTPHIANAWRISRRLAQTSRVDDLNLLLLESAPWGVVTLDRRGRVLSANGCARGIIARNDGLRLEHGELRASRAADDRSLQIKIGLSLKSACGEGFHPGGTLAVARSGGTTPYGLRILPTRHVVGALQENVPFVAVLISDPLQSRLPSREDLMVIFGLTPREAEISLHIAQGTSYAEAAEKMGIAPGTVRAHLANALAKTGVRNQGALVGLIRGLPSRDEQT